MIYFLNYVALAQTRIRNLAGWVDVGNDNAAGRSRKPQPLGCARRQVRYFDALQRLGGVVTTVTLMFVPGCIIEMLMRS